MRTHNKQLNNLNNKKGDGLSMNIIVIAVVALLILVILAVIVLRGTGNFSKGVNACSDESNGVSNCINYPESQCGDGYVRVPSSCTTQYGIKGNTCCTKLD